VQLLVLIVFINSWLKSYIALISTPETNPIQDLYQ